MTGAVARVAAALVVGLALLGPAWLPAAARAAGPVAAEKASPAAKAPWHGRLVLRPGRIEVQMGDEIWAVIPAPRRLDLTDLVELVADDRMISRLPDGRVELWVPIEQKPGSRLSVSGDSVPELLLMAGSRLSGSDALLSLHGANLTAAGDTGTGPAQPLIGYDQASGVRMSRLHIDDSRIGRAVGQVIEISGGSQLEVMSAVISGGRGGIRLDDVSPASLAGVRITHTHGTALTAQGSTDLVLAGLDVRSNAADGLSLSGAGLTLQVTGPIIAAGNRGRAVRLTGTRNLSPASIQVSNGKKPPHRKVTRSAPTGPDRDGRLPLAWLVAAVLLLLGPAVALEIVRQRRDPDVVVTAPEHVLNRH